MTQKAINPTTGEIIKEYEEMSLNEVEILITNMDSEFQKWRKKTFSERALLMKKAADILRDNADEYAELMALEMGKSIKGGRSEANKCAWVCDYYADNAEEFLKPEIVDTEADKSFVSHQPLGIVFAVMPWNFPFWQVLRFAAPTLMAGNAGLLKHAPNVPGCALAIEDVFHKAGFPKNIFRSIIIDVSIAKNIIENPLIKAVTLTGSTRAGKAVSAEAGAVLKKCVMELGGSDPYIILEDALIEDSVNTSVASRLINAGQSCIAAKRFIVVEKVYEEFEKLFVEEMKKYKMGDPLKEDTDLGPQARFDLRDELHRQVTESAKKGAKILLGGEIPDIPGAFYPQTVLANISMGMPAFDEELFGPVASLIKVRDEAEAIKIANNTVFGLGAAVFTQNIAKGERIATEELEAGACFVNAFVRSDPRLPFGGIKESGYGRELSYHGIKEFVNVKTVYIKNVNACDPSDIDGCP
ncbi:MAG: NAD-dependent succinate-semialdehyde dehydrogenase [Promethearchaeota archaeon]